MKYKIHDSNTISGINAEDVAAELERINEQDGVLIPSRVVDQARPVDAVLHPVFEWDDQIAAEKHREWQARSLIRAIVVIDETGKQCNKFINVKFTRDDGQTVRHYQDVTVVAKNVDQFESAVSLLREKLDAINQSINELQAMRSDLDGRANQRIQRSQRLITKASAELSGLAL